MPFGRYRVWLRGYDAANVPSAWSAPIEFSIGPQPVAPLGPTFEYDSDVRMDNNPRRGNLRAVSVDDRRHRSTNWSDRFVVDSGSTSAERNTAMVGSRLHGRRSTPGAWSDRIDSDIGGRPVMQTPTGTGSDASPEFTWTAVAGATLYDLYVSRLDVPGLAFREDSLTTSSFNAQVLPDGNYRVWVRAHDGASFGPWSRPVDFTVDADSVAINATPTSPLVATFDTTPTFTWTNEAGAATWDFFLTNGSTVIEQTGPGSAAIVHRQAALWPPATGRGGCERKMRSANAGPWSAPAPLHVGGRTVILAPVGATVDNTPVFQWAAVQGAGRYILHVETSGGTVVIREDNLVGTSYEAPAPMAAGNYRFWVKAINAADNVSGFWSEPTDFTIVNAEQFTLPFGNGNDNNGEREAAGNSLLANLLQVPLADQTATVRFNPPTVPTQLSPQSKPELNRATDAVYRRLASRRMPSAAQLIQSEGQEPVERGSSHRSRRADGTYPDRNPIHPTTNTSTNL